MPLAPAKAAGVPNARHGKRQLSGAVPHMCCRVMSHIAQHGWNVKRAAVLPRMLSMDRRDMLLVAALLLISIVATLVGTEYVLNNVVIPLIDDGRPDAPTR